MSTKTLSRTAALLITLVIMMAPVAGQQKAAPQKPEPAAPSRPLGKPARPAQPAATIDNLLANDSYKIYGELKNVGQLVSSGSIGEIIDPIMKLARPPKEFSAFVKFLNANAEALASSRLVFAAWPARAGLPDAIFVLEMDSPAEAAKFEPKLNRVLPVILPPLPPPPIAPAPGTAEMAPKVGKAAEPKSQAQLKTEQQSVTDAPRATEIPVPAPPRFVVLRSENLLIISEKAFKLGMLRPPGTMLLSEDQTFRLAHDRFASEQIFLYLNVALDADARLRQAPTAEVRSEEKPLEVKTEERPTDPQATVTMPDGETAESESFSENTKVEFTVRKGEGQRLEEPKPAPTPNLAQQTQLAAMSHLETLLGLAASGQPEWPDAVGLTITQDSESYVIRAWLVGPENGKRLVLPFAPQLIAGRAYHPGAPSILPDDTEIFVSASFDLTHSYEGMQAQLEKTNAEKLAQGIKVPVAFPAGENADQPTDPFLVFEKAAGFKIKDELLPALGNEIAVAASLKSLSSFGLEPATAPFPMTAATPAPNDQAKADKEGGEDPSPILLISVRDREAARRLMPKVLDGLGASAANLIAQTERREDTEMVNFAGAFAYAFVGDFLVISSAPSVRHLIDSYLAHQTLSGNSQFRNFTRWEPREMIGQIYVSPALMDSYQKAMRDPKLAMPVAMRELLMRISPTSQAITYALSNEAAGTEHELRLPKALVLASIAQAASESTSPIEANELAASGLLRTIASVEATYQATDGKGSYASFEKLVEAQLISKETFEKQAYRIEVTASGNQFEATATPLEYGTTGRSSFFVDQSGVVRGADHGGAPASVADMPLLQNRER